MLASHPSASEAAWPPSRAPALLLNFYSIQRANHYAQLGANLPLCRALTLFPIGGATWPREGAIKDLVLSMAAPQSQLSEVSQWESLVQRGAPCWGLEHSRSLSGTVTHRASLLLSQRLDGTPRSIAWNMEKWNSSAAKQVWCFYSSLAFNTYWDGKMHQISWNFKKKENIYLLLRKLWNWSSYFFKQHGNTVNFP